jgi:hypothetical protein
VKKAKDDATKDIDSYRKQRQKDFDQNSESVHITTEGEDFNFFEQHVAGSSTITAQLKAQTEEGIKKVAIDIDHNSEAVVEMLLNLVTTVDTENYVVQ